MYSIVKNPLYVGNFVAILGVLVSIKIWWLVLLGSAFYGAYIKRIIAAEEKFLTQTYGKTYTEWADKTPVFMPDFGLWEAPEMEFSLKTVLRREYNGFMAICAAFFCTELILDVYFEKEPFLYWLKEDWPWTLAFVIGSITFISLRTLKRHTSILKVQGR